VPAEPHGSQSLDIISGGMLSLPPMLHELQPLDRVEPWVDRRADIFRRIILGTSMTLILASALPAQSLGRPRPDIKKTEDGISYVSAGIGKESRENLPRFSLMLVFSTRNSRYLANIECEISPGPAGGATRIRSEGPWLLVDLPPVHYSATAKAANGAEVRKSFTVSKDRVTRVNLIWNLSDEDI
jgi:hypothetical protein